MARVLVLGGTGQIGPSVVETLQKNGHQVSVFNRNKRNPDAFRNIEQLVGDRDVPGGHDALKGKKWDIVFDIPTSNPRWIADAAAILKGNVGHYLYISSTAAFKHTNIAYQDETGPTADPSPSVCGARRWNCGSLMRLLEGIIRPMRASGRAVPWPQLAVVAVMVA